MNRPLFSRSWLLAALAAVTNVASAALPTPTIEDAISMVRIQRYPATNQPLGVFSADGRRFAAVTWQGDLKNNTNVYRLVVFDLSKNAQPAGPEQAVLTWTFAGDPEDQHASAFHQLTFLPDNRTLAFLGRRDDSGVAQVYSVDIETRQVTQLSKHSTPVRAFAMGADGSLKFFSAIADADEAIERRSRYEQDGVYLWDRSVLVPSRAFKSIRVLDPEPRSIRQYFFARRPDDVTLAFDSRQGRPTVLETSDLEVQRGANFQVHDEDVLTRWAQLRGDPRGRRALMYPYALADYPMYPERYRHHTGNKRYAAPYGLVDLETGKITRLLDAPRVHSPMRSPIWSPDGRSVIVHTLLPISADARNAEAPAQWVEVDVETGRTQPLNVPSDWEIAAWTASGLEVMLTQYRSSSFARITRRADGSWGELRDLGDLERLSPLFKPATDGAVVVGVQESFYSPPELVSVDLRTRKTRVLTQLNPQLHRRQYGEVTEFGWSHRYEPQASGLLIKPVGYEPSRRYPLVVLLDDATLKGARTPYVLEAVGQLSGHAVQMLAASGFAVLYTREPPSTAARAAGVQECERMREHVESAVARLNDSGIADASRVGLSGWSRAGYHTDCILMRSRLQFAAATQIDGGSREISPVARPFTDEELLRIRTPLLMQSHGLFSLVNMSVMADRLEAFGRPVEVLHFPTGNHALTRPGHRFRSLQSHMDWWRFWLLNQEDPDPARAPQFEQWRAIRDRWQRSGQK